jgi:hypothetical protein
MESEAEIPSPSRILVPLGVVTLTPRTVMVLTAREVELLELLARHQAGDWGEAAEGYDAENRQSLRDGGEVVSIYHVGGRPRLRIETQIQASTRVALLNEP